MKQNAVKFSALHLTQNDFITMDHTPDAELSEAFSAHLAECPMCAANYADYLLGNETLALPDGFSERLMTAVREAVAPKSPPIRKIHFAQVIKVSIAAVFAITMYTSDMADKLLQASAEMAHGERHQNVESVNDANEESAPPISEYSLGGASVDKAPPAADEKPKGDGSATAKAPEENLPRIVSFGEGIRHKFYEFTRFANSWFDKK